MRKKGWRGYDVVNRKAEQKLEFVVQRFVRAPGETSVLPVRVGQLAWELALPCCSEAGAITMSYRPTSKLFAVLYDFEVGFSVRGSGPCNRSIELAPRASGLVLRQDGERKPARFLSDELAGGSLVEDRLKMLGITRLSAEFDCSAGLWDVSLAAMVGSATWNLLPPVMHLIEPSPEECLRMIELVRLLAFGIACM